MSRETEIARIWEDWFTGKYAQIGDALNAAYDAALLADTPSVERPDLSCPKCGVNSHDNNGEGWTHACDQRFVAALDALPDRFIRPFLPTQASDSPEKTT